MEAAPFIFELGDRVKDVVSGFQGVVAARCQHITGCNTYGVNSRKLHEGKPVGTEWFDEPKLQLVKGGDLVLPGVKAAVRRGADNRNPDGTEYRRS